ncbi:thioredoxin family protein [Leeuwenhoekiella sp. MAR_2009_132]|uniref:thioredoxin family protein n=1 Tax=Leeuwenhoekiella sp. MAR_2009_132 TaxID=1392489 RepID=UPI00048D2C3B|nr:thioredoxin family protein [Leeuwenhoekiella sp. MAR_2009_132]
MARTQSNMLPLGTIAPFFSLLNPLTNKYVTLVDAAGELGTVVMFLCNHCPFVKHVNDEIVRIANDYRVLGFGFVAISSNDVEKYPEDSPWLMRDTAHKYNYSFPYLYDESQEVAQAYNAACTPDFYLFNAALKLVYRGQLDDSRPGNGIPVNGRDFREALDNIFNNRKQNELQKPSLGCGIKWKEIR